MSALSAAVTVSPLNGMNRLRLPIKTSDVMYKGSLVFWNGDGLATVTSTDKRFAGVAEKFVNASGNEDGELSTFTGAGISAASRVILEVNQPGKGWEFAGNANSLSAADVGKLVYATSSNPADISLTSTNNALIGILVGFKESRLVILGVNS